MYRRHCHLDEELFRVSDRVGVAPRSEEVRARGLLVEYGLRLICVTRGGAAACLFRRTRQWNTKDST